MKTNLIKLIFASCLIVAMSISCNKDDDDDQPASDPNVFCNEGICITNEAKKQECIDAFNTCMANNPDANDDECVATALLICNEIK